MTDVEEKCHGPVSQLKRVIVWDGWVRLFHWSTVALIAALWWSAEEARMDLHKWFGMMLLALVTFRLLWGLWGSATARFSSFVRGPAGISDYLKRGHERVGDVGHNPLGALSVVAMLLALVVQIGLGLFAQDVDGLDPGPLNYLISFETADQLTEIHKTGFNLLLGLIVMHLGAIAYYTLIKRDPLIPPMVRGWREQEQDVVQPAMGGRWHALATCAVAAAFTAWISLGMPGLFPGE